MPRRRRTKITRTALPASDLESKTMSMLRELKSCAKLKGVAFVFVGSFRQEPNWSHARDRAASLKLACANS